ncbi:MAG: BMP family ABC transporter substrate-binding protein [Lachnospiraceae bacterium]|nr:BMP family ABC transporter substrate-binding protein [Lachnospiraceae bacterium]
MSYTEYIKAQKMGNKAFQIAVARGQSPYLPVLDEILSHADIECEVALGTMDIPLEQVVGTSNFGRTTAFASNFMPLLDYGTEFGTKWSHLCDAQVEEGIHDAIKVYEYMNRYYVVEGNKRVSVLKYFDAVTITATVTRKVPKKTDDLENIMYYEFMDFYKQTENGEITCSVPGSFKRLNELTGHTETETWSEDDRLDLLSFYHSFKKVYMENGGAKLNITCGDALLAFLKIYDYKSAKDMTPTEIKENIVKSWSEITLVTKDEAVELLMNPSEAPRFGVFGSFFKGVGKKMKVAFIYDRYPEQSDWIYSHELGRLHVQEVMNDVVESIQITCLNPEKYGQAVLEEVINDGYTTIFDTTTEFIQPSLRVALDHPDVKILNCSLNISHNAIRTYEARLYEAKFITGMIAGSVCDDNKIGYIADYPVYGAIANINAFARGAKMTNPRARIYLDWSTKKDHDCNEYFRENNIHCISDQDLITPEHKERKFGLYNSVDGKQQNIAMSICHWGVFYEKLISNIISGGWRTESWANTETKALNYWWGMSADVIDVIYSQNLPLGVRTLADIMKNQIKSGSFHPFSGPQFSQNGEVEASKKGYLTPEEIIEMNWLNDNVIGAIPLENELLPKAKTLLDNQGVTPCSGDTKRLTPGMFHAQELIQNALKGKK